MASSVTHRLVLVSARSRALDCRVGVVVVIVVLRFSTLVIGRVKWRFAGVLRVVVVASCRSILRLVEVFHEPSSAKAGKIVRVDGGHSHRAKVMVAVHSVRPLP